MTSESKNTACSDAKVSSVGSVVGFATFLETLVKLNFVTQQFGMYFVSWSQGCMKTSELGHMVLSKDRAIRAPDFFM